MHMFLDFPEGGASEHKLPARVRLGAAMPNGAGLGVCRHCGNVGVVHPWGDPPFWYCDACFDWWEGEEVYWSLWYVLQLERSAQPVTIFFSSEGIARRVGAFLIFSTDVQTTN